MRFFIEFSYAGTKYHGWQRQSNANSIQEEMENALSTLLNVPTNLVASGRTDAGVHAKQMFAHFDSEMNFEKQQNLVYQLNQFLPPDIAIISLKKVKFDAHARFDAISRTYEYHIKQFKTPFGNELHHVINQSLNFEAMNEGARILLEYEDFECFSKKNTDVKTFLCKITFAQWGYSDKGYTFTIKANRFLRNMVRSIVGTLLEIGLNKIGAEGIHKIIESKNRSLAGYSVPAQGLFLKKIEYPDNLFI